MDAGRVTGEQIAVIRMWAQDARDGEELISVVDRKLADQLERAGLVRLRVGGAAIEWFDWAGLWRLVRRYEDGQGRI